MVNCAQLCHRFLPRLRLTNCYIVDLWIKPKTFTRCSIVGPCRVRTKGRSTKRENTRPGKDCMWMTSHDCSASRTAHDVWFSSRAHARSCDLMGHSECS